MSQGEAGRSGRLSPRLGAQVRRDRKRIKIKGKLRKASSGELGCLCEDQRRGTCVHDSPLWRGRWKEVAGEGSTHRSPRQPGQEPDEPRQKGRGARQWPRHLSARLQDRCSRSGERRVHACVRTTLSARKPDLDMYGEDSAQEGTQVFCDRGRQKRMNAGCSPTSKNSRNITEPHRLCPGQVSVQRHLTGQHVGTWEMGTLSTGEVPKNTR